MDWDTEASDLCSDQEFKRPLGVSAHAMKSLNFILVLLVLAPKELKLTGSGSVQNYITKVPAHSNSLLVKNFVL